MSGHHAREESLFAAALEQPAAQRNAFLAQACGGDTELLDRLLALVAAHEGGDSLMNSAAPEPLNLFRDEYPGNRIGRYKLLQKIGEGGCGVVHLAEQEEPVRRRVALKVIKLGLDTKAVIARFEAERQALAMMDHPNIARVLDAGATEAGRPFFVMELVRGIKITEYCDQHNVPTAERLKLFSQVCHAVQHAHQKGIIHRDLKPSNILVAVNDDMPVPKVIDFGIAKATLGRLTDNTVFTAMEQFIGTPAYISPEQAEMSSLDIDTRSDIYSLGVLLYELLTGRTPFETKELMEAGFDRIRRHIREVEPPRPSVRLRTLMPDTLSTTAKHRQTDAPKLINLIRGDLDWIVMRCLEKDRTRRYQTATSLAHDLQRYLNHEPVTARPAGATYRFRKLIRRNRLAVAGAAAVTLALVLGLLASIWQATRANREASRANAAERTSRAEAERANVAERAAQDEAATAKAVNDFLVWDLLRQADSRVQAADNAAPNPDLKVREALDRAAEKVGVRFKNQPLAEAAVREAIGQSYMAIGDYAKALLHNERALQLRKRVLGAEHRDTLNSMSQLASAYQAQGRYAEAAKLHSQTLEARKRLFGAEHPSTLSSITNLGIAYQGQGKFAEAAELHSQTLEIRKRLLGLEHPDTLLSMSNLAASLQSQGRATEAAALYAQTLEIRKRVLGPEHPDTLNSMDQVARAYAFKGNYAEAIALHLQALEMKKRVLGADHPATLDTRSNLAVDYGKLNDLPNAEAQYRELLAGRQRRDGLDSSSVAGAQAALAMNLIAQKKLVDAESMLREALTIGESKLPDDWQTFRLRSLLGSVLLSQRRFAEAEPLLISGYGGVKQREATIVPGGPARTKEALDLLVRLYTNWGKPDQAALWRQKRDGPAPAQPNGNSPENSRSK